ncbi:MAG: hypothetical protein ACRDA3_11665 [Peptostreptococcaceae bacterium]
MNIENQLKSVFNVILEEIKINEEFAKRIELALAKEELVKETSTKEKVENKSKRRKKQPALLNPNTVITKGEDVLKKELDKLEVPQLKDIISQYAMDPGKTTNKWKKKDRFINYIIEVATLRSKKGEAFK